MDEQSPNGSQPKVRRAKNDSAAEPRPSVTGAESAHMWEAPEDVSEDLLYAGEDVSRETNKEISQVESALLWPFQTTQHALDEWTHFIGRATQRNSRAAEDLSECDSITSLLQWQRDLVQSNVEDWLQTSFSVFGILCGSFSHTEPSERAAT